MNAIVQHTPASSGGLIPHDMTSAMRLAEMMSTGKLVPSHLQRSPGDCLMVVEQAMRWGMSPFAVAQSTSVIQGKLMFEGKLVAAALQASGILSTRFDYEFDGEGDKRAVVATATIRGEAKAKTVRVEIKEVKTTNGMWTKQPDQQLIYSANRIWARRFTPEVMLGVYTPEEFAAPAAADTFQGTTVSTTAEPTPQKAAPAPSPIDTIRTRLAACNDTECVTRVGDAWRKTVDKAREAGRPFSDVMLEDVTAMLADAYGQFVDGGADDAGEPVDENEMPS